MADILSYLSTPISFISFIFILGILVFFHELGHYWVARRNGVVVEEFGMGYPPRAVKLFRYDGTDFTLNWIPFGGFARMRGEDAADMSPGSFNAASAAGRALTLFAGPFMNLLLAVVLFTGSYMIGGSETVAARPQLTNASNPVAQRIGLQEGDVLLQAGGSPVYISALEEPARLWRPATDDPVNLTMSRQGVTKEVSGVQVSDLTELLISQDLQPVLTTRINAVTEKTPAEQAGIEPGDLVYSVSSQAGEQLVTLDQPLNQIVQENLGKEITLTLLRGDQFVKLQITPRVNPPEGQGSMGVQIGAVGQFARLPFLQSVWRGIMNTLQYVMVVLQLPILLVLGQVAPSAATVSGPVGIAREVGSTVTYTLNSGIFWPIWHLSAILSAALAVTNLLPLPALDGGRLLFILIEKIRGRRVNPEREGLVHMVGFVLLLSLMVVITIRDIASPQSTIDWSTIIGQ